MFKAGRSAVLGVALTASVALLAGCGSGTPFSGVVPQIAFATQSIPPGGAGQLYNVPLEFITEGGAPTPDTFEVVNGTLPVGVTLVNTGSGAALVGFPRQAGTYSFTIKAIATSTRPALATQRDFTTTIGEGRINILSPTALEGTTDVAVPAFPSTIDFVNPANPQAFFSFAFLVAGGSGDNLLNVYLPRELELSVFDTVPVDGSGRVVLSNDTDESANSGSKFAPDFTDGGWFVLQAGNSKVQVGGFQSPRGPVGTVTEHGPVSAPIPGLDPAWFQKPAGSGGPALSSRRDFADTLGLAGGDTVLIPGRTIRFADYFDPNYEGTDPNFTDPDPLNPPVLTRRKYPFPASEYDAAFFLEFNPATDLTPLKYYAIVEAIDRRGTSTKLDDVIARKAYVVQVRIPDIVIDSVFLPNGQAGVDYTPFVSASGGVPPLLFDLEWVDGTADGAATPGDALTKQDFGVELNTSSGRFFGVPRAAATGANFVDLTVRVFAAVMNPLQNGDAFVPTGTAGEFNGRHPVTGKRGIHKTFAVQFTPPSIAQVGNSSLVPGTDGVAYPGDRVFGVGGVPNLVPYPVGFVGTYPAGTARRNYELSAQYPKDASHPGQVGQITPGLPNALTLDGDPASATNGNIFGTPLDRGFHPVTFTLRDFYYGQSSAPNLALNRQVVTKTLALSISPDTAVYLRGVSGTGGEPTGLEDPTGQMGLARNVPIALAAGVFSVETGKTPVRNTALPIAFDILPVMLANGGEDENVNKGIPSLSGFWPAESNKETGWIRSGFNAWQHLQQEFIWVQTPTPQHLRVFLWGETNIKKFNSSATVGQESQRYQEFDPNGKRGVLVVNPLSGDYWAPAILDNGGANAAAHGSQFAGEFVLNRGDESFYQYEGVSYFKFYYYGQTDTRSLRDLHSQGLGAYIETYSGTSSFGWYRASAGRSAVSIAVSADGIWGATAMPGGNGPKILLWRNDKQALPSWINSLGYVVPLNGRDASGNPLNNSACIIDLDSTATSSGVNLASASDRILLPDSLMFAEDGLLFLLEGYLNRVFGLSLVDGHVSSVVVPAADASSGMYIPDQDYLRGELAPCNFSAQFAFAGNKPAAGEEGPNGVAFVAGSNFETRALFDLSGRPRDGYVQKGNRTKQLYFLKLNKNASGLDLNNAANRTLTELTASSQAFLGGDLLTPGRLGEEQDWLAVSPDGKYVAVVRDNDVFDYTYYTSFFGTSTWTAYQTFSTTQYSGSANWQANDDLLLFAVNQSSDDLDSSTSGNQNALFIGSHAFASGTTTNPYSGLLPTTATGRPHFNATYRRISGLVFGANTGAGERSLIVKYQGESTYHPKFNGWYQTWIVNPGQPGGWNYATHMSVRIQFKANNGVDGANMNSASSYMTNSLAGLSTSAIGGLGPTTAPFASTATSDQLFWSTFRSQNGNFLYYVSDGASGRNLIVGFNISASTIGGRAPYAAFTPHAATVGLEQIDANAFQYSNRFFAVPAGVTNPASGRDGAGLVFFIASAASAGATSATDLEVYVFDANVGGDAVVLTPNVTTGTANAINHLYVSADGSVVAGHRSATTANSRDNRAILNGSSDLWVCNNVHQALAGSPPNNFIVSAGQSHGSTMAFIGEGSASGPQAVVFSSAPSGGNDTWDDRTLKAAVLAANATAVELDNARSHYAVLAGARRLDDDPNSAN